ncbi:MAG TPA: XylR family transcriptional regulator [Kiritimatiellia bacterium]|nr:XylR family transcriptional regulator [Kiritimatiellia bacterium]
MQKRSMRNKMPHVAVLLETSHGVSRAMLQGIFRYVNVYGPWSINLIEGGASDQRMPDRRRWKGDGIIARVPNDDVARSILSSKLPAVLFNPADTYLAPSHPLSRYSRIQFDSHAIGTIAAEYFLGRTPRRYAFVGHPADPNWSRWRRDAFVQRLHAAGVAYDLYPLPSPNTCDWTDERPAFCRWLRRLPKPAALFAANDNRARQVLDACLIADISVPYEVTVLGVNNDPLICETCLPPLSSIAVDDEKAGYEAAQLLDNLMQGKERPGRVIRHEPKAVVERASTADLCLSDKLAIQALEFIRINSGFNIRVSDVAEYLGVTSRWAENRFKMATGQSLHQTIHAIRMETVRKMVTEGDLPFHDIAMRCGFRSANHLCKLFKLAFGRTMSEMRNL